MNGCSWRYQIKMLHSTTQAVAARLLSLRPYGIKTSPAPYRFFAFFAPLCGYFVLRLCAFASPADVAKGGDGAKSALREIFLSS